jgi:hypothetical protein
MINPVPLASTEAPATPAQVDLPGIPRSSSLHEILASYGLTPSEAPGGVRLSRHELVCNHLRAIAEFCFTADGDVESFKIWSERPRKKRGRPAKTAS